MLFHDIEAYLRPNAEKIGAVIEDLRSGERLEIQPHRQFKAASLIKNTILWTYYKKIAAGELDRAEIYALEESVKVGETPFDTGILRDLHSGIGLTLEDVATMMIVVSDDTATNIMINRLGQQTISDEIQALGLQQTKLQRKMMEYEKAARGIDNMTSAADMAELYRKMLRGDGMPEPLCREMLTILGKQRYTQGLPSKLPETVRIAHKTGTIGQFGLEHDVGVLYGPDGSPAVLACILTQGLSDSLNTIGTVAKMAYENVCRG